MTHRTPPPHHRHHRRSDDEPPEVTPGLRGLIIELLRTFIETATRTAAEALVYLVRDEIAGWLHRTRTSAPAPAPEATTQPEEAQDDHQDTHQPE